MENPFTFDETTETPSKKEIKKTFRKEGKMRPMVHPIIKTILVYTTIIILIGGGYLGYTKMTDSSIATGGVTGLSKFSSSITGFFVQEPLKKGEEFEVKITGKKIDLSSEEAALKSNLNSDLTARCSKEKIDVKLATENKMKTVCQMEKNEIQADVNYWEDRYNDCNDNE